MVRAPAAAVPLGAPATAKSIHRERITRAQSERPLLADRSMGLRQMDAEDAGGGRSRTNPITLGPLQAGRRIALADRAHFSRVFAAPPVGARDQRQEATSRVRYVAAEPEILCNLEAGARRKWRAVYWRQTISRGYTCGLFTTGRAPGPPRVCVLARPCGRAH